MKKIPQETVSRLSSYLRQLLVILPEKQKISSFELADGLGINPNQLRKDLSYFGKFGRRGIGYSVTELIDNLKQILGLHQAWNVALFGLGNLGKALFSYRGFSEQGFVIKVIFEKDKKKIGKRFNNIDVRSIDEVGRKINKYNVNIAILAVPIQEAQATAEIIYQTGIRAILNFAPTNINLPSDCLIRNVIMSSELIYLSYFLAKR